MRQKNTLTINTFRLALSGALIGVAIAGLLSSAPYHDAIGALIGGASVLAAKAKHFF